jgi:hypothetical protein
MLRHSQLVIAYGGFQPFRDPHDHACVGIHANALSIARTSAADAHLAAASPNANQEQLLCRYFAVLGALRQSLGTARVTAVAATFMVRPQFSK